MRFKCLLLLFFAPVLFSGCGGGGGSSDSNHSTSSSAKFRASEGCMESCHSGVTSPVTGAKIADEWSASVHNTKDAAGCADCHEPTDAHLTCNRCHGGGGSGVTRNPDQSGKCGKCHGPSHPDDVMMALAPQHYGYSTARQLPQGTRASYVSGQYVNRCRACHNPHNNTLTAQHRAYATSLHGDPTGVAWTHYDFKQYPDCIRCHTTTGFKSFVTSNFTVPTHGFGAGDPTREVLACDGCHASFDYKNSLRKVPAFTASYKSFNGVDKARYPDVGETNLCIPCHSGRESGQSINAITDFTNAKFVNSHYLAAAGLMYMQIGFIDFTSLDAPIGSKTYRQTLSPDDASTPGGIVGGQTSTHRKFGTPLINADRHKPTFFVPGVFDQNGPCVTCHLNAYGVAKRAASGHSLKIDGNAYNQVCINCHTTESGTPLSASNFRTLLLEPQSEAFETSLELIKHILLTQYKISFNEAAHPYFYDEDLPLVDGKKQPVKDWTRGGSVNGRKLMGACFNLNLLVRDPAAYAHARSYSRRLIYDSIDFLDDGIMNLSVSYTAEHSGLTVNGSPAFSKGTGPVDATEAMLFLISGSTRTNTWNTPERP